MNNLSSFRHRVKVQLNAERTEDEVLAELHFLKNRVDITHNLVSHLNKKLEAFVRDYGKHTEEKKLLKKIPEEIVSVVMRQYGASLLKEFPETSILGNVVSKCGETEHDMAQFQANYESRLEQSVLAPLQTLLEDDFEVIQKNMLDLKNLAMKVDMAKSRYKDSNDKLSKYLKSGLVDAEREKSLKDKLNKDEDEVEITTQNMEQFKDAVATNLLTFVNKEAEMSEKLVDLLIIQRDYHYSCYRQIDELVPILRDRMVDYAHKSVYGTALSEHLRVTGREVAQVLEESASVMAEIGLEEEGLLRIPGSNSRIKRIIAAFNYPGEVDWDYFASDIHSICGALKQYFRDLPECLLTDNLFDAWLEVAQKLQTQISEGGGGEGGGPPELDLSLVSDLLYQLPKCNFINLRYLIKFLQELTKHSDSNKMTATNIAIVMGGNLLWRQGQEAFVLRHTPYKNLLVEIFISHCDTFFPEFAFSPKLLLSPHKSENEALLHHHVETPYQVSHGLLAAPATPAGLGVSTASSTNSLNSIGDRETSPAIALNQISQSPDGSSLSSFAPDHRRNGSGGGGGGGVVEFGGGLGVINHHTIHPPKATDGLLQKLTTPTPRKSFKQRPAPSPAAALADHPRPGSSTLPRPRSETPPDLAPPSRPSPVPPEIVRPAPAPPPPPNIHQRPLSGPPSHPPPPVIRPTPAPRDSVRPVSGGLPTAGPTPGRPPPSGGTIAAKMLSSGGGPSLAQSGCPLQPQSSSDEPQPPLIDAPRTELPVSRTISFSRESSPAVGDGDVVAASAAAGGGDGSASLHMEEVDASAISLDIVDTSPPSKLATLPPASQLPTLPSEPASLHPTTSQPACIPSSAPSTSFSVKAGKPEKPPISRNKPSLSDDRENTPTSNNNNNSSDNQHSSFNETSSRPPRPQSKPRLPHVNSTPATPSASAASATTNGGGRPPPRPTGGPPPHPGGLPPQPAGPPPHPAGPPPHPPSNRLPEGDDVFTHL